MFTGVLNIRAQAQAKTSKWIDGLIKTCKDLCRSLRVQLENLISEPTWDSLAHVGLLFDLDEVKPKIKQLEKLKKETKGAQLFEIEECIQLFEDVITDLEKANSGKRCSLDIMHVRLYFIKKFYCTITTCGG